MSFLPSLFFWGEKSLTGLAERGESPEILETMLSARSIRVSPLCGETATVFVWFRLLGSVGPFSKAGAFSCFTSCA